MLKINTTTQTLSHYKEPHNQNNKPIKTYSISSAKNGLGEVEDSECTPSGMHKIVQKIGESCPLGAVFVGRVWTGEVYADELAQKQPNRDWILSRILWLGGCEVGNANSQQRYIYIHASPDSEPMGVPLSHGCIRMCSEDMINLFEQVVIGESVLII